MVDQPYQFDFYDGGGIDVAFLSFAAQERRRAVFVTERAVFRLQDGRLRLEEIAPGIDLERNVLTHMDFAPDMPEPPRLMDTRLFGPERMGLSGDATFAAPERS